MSVFSFLSVSSVWSMFGLLLVIFELVFSSMVPVFFAFGAFSVAFLSLFFVLTTAMRLAIFLFLSLTSLIFLRASFKKLLSKKSNKTDDTFFQVELIGKHVNVSEDILPPQNGYVMVNGVTWEAISDRPLYRNDVVEITAINGLKLIVKPVSS